MTDAQNIDIEALDSSIRLLNEYVQDETIRPFISALEALKKEPGNESLLTELFVAFHSLGIVQGAVLTYAPYIITLMSDDPFGFKEP